MGADGNKALGTGVYATNALPIATMLLSLLYLIFTFLYLSGFDNPDGSPSPPEMAWVTGASAFVFACLGLLVRKKDRDLRHDTLLAGVCSLLVLANISIHFGVIGQAWHGYNFVFYQVAIGALVVSSAWLIALLILTPLAACTASLIGIGSVRWDLLAAVTILGTTLSALLHLTRRRGLQQLEQMTRRAEANMKVAESALESSRQNASGLERAQEDLQGILEKSPDAILIHREDTILYVNPAFLGCLRLKPSDVLSRRVQEFSIDGQGMPKSIARLSFRRLDRETVVMQFSKPVEVQYRNQTAVLSIGRDVTAQDADLQAKLLLADRMAAIGVLAAGVAHEVNNPLSYVIGNLEILETSLDALSKNMLESERLEIKELIDDSLHGSRRVAEIVSELNAIARPHSAIGAVDLRECIRSATKIAGPHLLQNVEEIQLSLPPSLPLVRGSHSRLSQVFINLLINAAHALDSNRPANSVSVRAWTEDGFVTVEVRDTGIGMSAETQRRLFDPFFTTKDIGKGTGLGLYFCLNEAIRSGGSIDFESEVGEGTIFRVRLPIAAPVAAIDGDSEDLVLGKVQGVLIVDDEPLVAAVLKRLLGDEEAQIATSAREALALMERQEFEIIFCDLMMREMSGPQLYERVVKLHSRLADRFIFITGGSFSEATDTFAKAHSERMLYKPFDRAAIAAMLSKLRAQA